MPNVEDSSGVSRADFAELRTEFSRFMMLYQFGISELMTKVNILKDEFTHINQYSPIEHVTSRVKSPDSILRKAQRLNIPLTIDDISKNIFDIAGVRITCSFISDTYRIAEMLTSQTDLRVIEREDYIADPKPNGYKSLHLIVEVPVFMSDRVRHVPIELQIRTIAMDFWASSSTRSITSTTARFLSSSSTNSPRLLPRHTASTSRWNASTTSSRKSKRYRIPMTKSSSRICRRSSSRRFIFSDGRSEFTATLP
ncbi:hypothetical protein N806_22660 [Rhodococcus sp. P27]|nr:hypothetical protein N806_22660 [Rhodococcus sp. P27]